MIRSAFCRLPNRFTGASFRGASTIPFLLLSKEEGKAKGKAWVKNSHLWDTITKTMYEELEKKPDYQCPNPQLNNLGGDGMVTISYSHTQDNGEWVAHTLMQETLNELYGIRTLYDRHVVNVELLDEDRWADYGLLAYMTGHVRIVPTLLSDELHYWDDEGVVNLGGRSLEIDKWLKQYLKARNETDPNDDTMIPENQLDPSDIISLSAWMRTWPVAERIVGGTYGKVSITKNALEKLVNTFELLQEAEKKMSDKTHPRHEHWVRNGMYGMPSTETLRKIFQRIRQTSKITELPPGCDDELTRRVEKLELIRKDGLELETLLRAVCSDTFMNCEAVYPVDKFRIVVAVLCQLTGVRKEVARRIAGEDVRATVDVDRKLLDDPKELKDSAKHFLCKATQGIRNIHYNGHRAAPGDSFPVAKFVPSLALSITASILPDKPTKDTFTTGRLTKAWDSFGLASVVCLIKDSTNEAYYKLMKTEQDEEGWLPHEPFAYKAVYLRAQNIVEDHVLVDLIVCSMDGVTADSVETHIRFYGRSEEPFLPLFDDIPMAGVMKGTKPELCLRKPFSKSSVKQCPSFLKDALAETNPFLKRSTLGDIVSSRDSWTQQKQCLWTGTGHIKVEVDDDRFNRGVTPLLHAHVPFAKGDFKDVYPALEAK